MKSSRVLMHIDLTCMDMTALTQRKNFSTCLSDSPLFLKVETRVRRRERFCDFPTSGQVRPRPSSA